MDWFAKSLIKFSLVWLALGVTLRVGMAAHTPWGIFRTAHLHMLVLGIVYMMICGVAYHVIPRFVSAPLHSRRAPVWHLFLSNIGLAFMVIGFAFRAMGGRAGTPILATGGVLSAVGAYTFVYVIWRTMGNTRMKQPVALTLHRTTAIRSET